MTDQQPPAWYLAAEQRAHEEAPSTPEPTVQATNYVVSCLPEGDINRRHYTLNVAHRGGDTWAVIHSPYCLSTTGDWDFEHIPSERTDQWSAEHRFDLDTALTLAKQHARLIHVTGRTVTDALGARAKRQEAR